MLWEVKNQKNSRCDWTSVSKGPPSQAEEVGGARSGLPGNWLFYNLGRTRQVTTSVSSWTRVAKANLTINCTHAWAPGTWERLHNMCDEAQMNEWMSMPCRSENDNPGRVNWKRMQGIDPPNAPSLSCILFFIFCWIFFPTYKFAIISYVFKNNLMWPPHSTPVTAHFSSTLYRRLSCQFLLSLLLLCSFSLLIKHTILIQ